MRKFTAGVTLAMLTAVPGVAMRLFGLLNRAEPTADRATGVTGEGAAGRVVVAHDGEALCHAG